ENQRSPLPEDRRSRIMRSLKQMLARGLGAGGLFGLRYECPMCGVYLRAFVPGGPDHAVLVEKSIVGGGPRSTMFCPVCWSMDRERLVYLYLKHRPHLLPEGTKLLHVAPEKNLGSWLRSNSALDYVTADIKADDVDLHFDLTNIPLLDSTFNGIICNHVL